MLGIVAEWLHGVWGNTSRLEVLAGGEDAGVVADRRVLVVIDDGDVLSRMRRLTSTGTFTGDICRCPGEMTLALYRDDGELLGSGAVHGGDVVAWKRDEFHDDLEILNPLALSFALAELGVPGLASAVLPLFLDVLGLREGDIQLRLAGEGSDDATLATRRMPEVLWSDLRAISSEDLGRLGEVEFARLSARLQVVAPDPVRRMLLLLEWLGSLTWPTEITMGEGVFVRWCLDRFDVDELLEQIDRELLDSELMGMAGYALFRSDDRSIMNIVGRAGRNRFGRAPWHTLSRGD